MRVLAVLALASVAFSGCLASTATPEDTLGPAEATLPLDDVAAMLEAGEPSANLALLAEKRDIPGSEAAAHGDLLYVMSAGTVRVFDVSDPADVKDVATIDPAHRVLDVKLSDDGRFLFVGDDEQGTTFLNAGTPARGNGGMHVYDVTDPEDAKHVDFEPIGPRRGPHMVAYHRYPDGREVVFGANADVSISEFDRDAGKLTLLSRYEPDLVWAYNRDPQVFDVLYQGWAHDMFVTTEEDGTVLMWVANWDAGLRIVDVTDPSAPKEIGGWNDFPDGDEGNLHTVATEWIGDRRITVGSVEVGFAVVGGYHYAKGTDHSVIYVWDTTDPADIELLGTWENPVDPTSGRDRVPGEAVSSTHNIQLEDGRLYLAHYALGLWILDVSTHETQAAPEILAYRMEEGQSTWDVIVHRGVTITSGAEGVLALRFHGDVLGAEGVTSRA